MKKKVLYVAAVLAALIFIWLGKEDSKPLVLKGTDLNQTAGISDYTGLIAIDESAAYYGMFAYTDDYVLNKGTYTIRPEYSNTSSDNIIEVWDNGTKVAQWSLESTDGVKTARDYTFTLDKDSQQLHIRIYYQGVGSLILNTMSLIPQGAFYRDAPVPYGSGNPFGCVRDIPCVLRKKASFQPGKERLPS